ncbi:MAG: hypothetical protein QME81_08070, partial [bacterium]|nr:hypothetical protein [bacterium]
MRKILLLLLLGIVLFASTTYAVESAPRITDREIIESLTAIRGDIKRLEQQIDGLAQRMDRFESELKGFMIWEFGILFSGIMILVGFILYYYPATFALSARMLRL